MIRASILVLAWSPLIVAWILIGCAPALSDRSAPVLAASVGERGGSEVGSDRGQGSESSTPIDLDIHKCGGATRP